MEKSQTSELAAVYEGNLIESGVNLIESLEVKIEGLNETLIKVSFYSDLGKIVFRALVSSQAQGAMIFIQKKICKDYILSGNSGFLMENSNIHGGFINKLNSFYFHIKLSCFNGQNRFCYFLGERKSIVSKEYLKS